jgi:hypothetical protein
MPLRTTNEEVDASGDYPSSRRENNLQTTISELSRIKNILPVEQYIIEYNSIIINNHSYS